MRSKRYFLFLIFGISLLPRIYSETFPSLFVLKKPNKSYAVADQILVRHVKDQNNAIKFYTPPEHLLFNACPEEKAPHRRPGALKVQELVTDFETIPLEQFVKGDFVRYNCRKPIRPIALKSKEKFLNKLTAEYIIGFLMHENNADFGELWKKYNSVPKVPEYDFMPFLTVAMDRQLGAVISVRYHIISRGFLELESTFDHIPTFEKNSDDYGFDLNLLYNKEYQQKMFSLIFGDFSFHYYNYEENRYLIKVQLAPYEDFLLDTWKLPTFMDLNTVAMWKQLHSQWRKIEIFVRKVARNMEPLFVQTGTAKILTLADEKGELQSVYLRKGRKSPAFQYIWKLISFKPSDDDEDTQAILIIMHNDPYTRDQVPICEDVSESLGWIVSNKDYETGLTYACQVVQDVITQLNDQYEGNYASLNLNNVQKLESEENDTFPSLFIIKKPTESYTVASKFEHVEGQDNVVKFSTSPEYQLYNACPEENAALYLTYALKTQELVTDFEASALQQFVKGDFVKYNCRNPIKPIVLKSKLKFKDKFAVQYDTGFLIHDTDSILNNLSEKYENFTEVQEYNLLHFLAITMDRKSGTIMSVLHRIITRGLLEPESSYLGPFQPNENNFDVYGFDVNSLYTEENQQKMFSSIFGKFSSHYYNHSDRFLLKVQLAPHQDFLLDTWKLPSLMDLNTAAMWRQLYSQWRKIEIFVRKVAQELEALTIETGAAKILSLPDGNQQKQQVYLRKKRKSPVAKYIWKLVKYDQLNDDAYTQAILIIMHNDPYTTDQKPICDDVSESLGWIISNNDYKTGLTYVCPVVRNVTSELHEEYENVNYDVLNLNNVYELYYDENRRLMTFFDDIYSKVMSRF